MKKESTFVTLSGVTIPNRLFVYMMEFCPRIMDRNAFKRLRLVSKSWYKLIDKALIKRCFRVFHGNIYEVRKVIREINIFEIRKILISLKFSSNCCLTPLVLFDHVKEIIKEAEIVALDFSQTCIYNPELVSVIEKILVSCSRLEVLKLGNIQAKIDFHMCKNLKYFSCNTVGYNSGVKVNLLELKFLEKISIDTIVQGKVKVPKGCKHLSCRTVERRGKLDLSSMEVLDNVSIGRNKGIVSVNLKRLRFCGYIKWSIKMGPSYVWWLILLMAIFVMGMKWLDGGLNRVRGTAYRVLLRFLELL